MNTVAQGIMWHAHIFVIHKHEPYGKDLYRERRINLMQYVVFILSMTRGSSCDELQAINHHLNQC